MRPLDIRAPVTPVTMLQLRRARIGDACFAALATGNVTYIRLPNLAVSEKCGIRDRLQLTKVGAAKVARLETTCSIALRLALWERHSLQKAARDLGAQVVGIRHFSSYNCRPIRTLGGQVGRMSAHATAEAIDISGVVLSDGRELGLFKTWDRTETAQFWRDAFAGTCRWFVTSLGPDYNALHRDHFHLQSRGWGLCR